MKTVSIFNEQKTMDKLIHFLPAQSPLKDFITQNRLVSVQDKSFHKALKYASEIFGYRVYLPLKDFRELFNKEVINKDILFSIIADKKGVENFKYWCWLDSTDKALWHTDNSSGKLDTINDNMNLYGADVFFEMPLSEKRNCISAYVAYTDYQMGKNYIRNLGVMNPSNGLNGVNSTASGNSVPLIGTGQSIFAQLAYKFKDNLLVEQGTFQIYGSAQISKYQALNNNMMLYEGGINWLINGDHHSKLTLSYQSRPVYNIQADGTSNYNTRRGIAVLQYQISL